MTPAAVVLALLLAFPHTPARACLVARQEAIVVALTEALAQYPTVPPEVLAAVAFAETHVGCDAGESGGWGAPISATRRSTAGTHLHAASILAASFVACGGVRWEPALRRFNTGLCAHSRRTGVSPAYAMFRERGDWYVRVVWRVVQRLRTVALPPTRKMTRADGAR